MALRDQASFRQWCLENIFVWSCLDHASQSEDEGAIGLGRLVLLRDWPLPVGAAVLALLLAFFWQENQEQG